MDSQEYELASSAAGALLADIRGLDFVHCFSTSFATAAVASSVLLNLVPEPALKLHYLASPAGETTGVVVGSVVAVDFVVAEAVAAELDVGPVELAGLAVELAALVAVHAALVAVLDEQLVAAAEPVVAGLVVAERHVELVELEAAAVLAAALEITST